MKKFHMKRENKKIINNREKYGGNKCLITIMEQRVLRF